MNTLDPDCPPWCDHHVEGSGGTEHRAVVGDVRLTLVRTLTGITTRWAVRRQTFRSPEGADRVCQDLAAAAALLHGIGGLPVASRDPGLAAVAC